MQRQDLVILAIIHEWVVLVSLSLYVGLFLALFESTFAGFFVFFFLFVDEVEVVDVVLRGSLLNRLVLTDHLDLFFDLEHVLVFDSRRIEAASVLDDVQLFIYLPYLGVVLLCKVALLSQHLPHPVPVV